MRTFATSLAFLSCIGALARADVETVGDFTWSYSVCNEGAVVETVNYADNSTEERPTVDVNVPAMLGGFPVIALSDLNFVNSVFCDTLVLPETIKSVGMIGWGMYQPPEMNKIDVADGNPSFSSQDGILYDKTRKRLIYCPIGKSGTLSVPEGTEEIGDYGIETTNISVLKIPASVRLIGDSGMGEAFFDNWKLKRIDVDPDNKYYSSFDGCLYDKNKTAFLYAPSDRYSQIVAEENGDEYECADLDIRHGTKYYAGPGIWMCCFGNVFIPDSVIHFGTGIEGGAVTISVPERFESENLRNKFIFGPNIVYRPVLQSDRGLNPPNDDFDRAEPVFGDSGYVIGFTSYGSVEDGEQFLAPTQTSSVWYSWTAPKSGTVSFSLHGRTLQDDCTNCLAVLKGNSISGLRKIPSETKAIRRDAIPSVGIVGGGDSFHCCCTVDVEAGKLYFLSVSENSPESGEKGRQGSPLFRLDWDYVAESPETRYPEPTSISPSWIADNAPSILAAHGGDYEVAAMAKAANGRPVWECYVADLDPEKADADLKVSIEMADGKPRPFILSGESAERKYETQGAPTPTGPWGAVADDSRFFRVKVSLP